MAELPAYVKYAFHAVEVLSIDDEYQQDFARRWGGLDLATFARALREGDRHDQQVATFAIGCTASAWSRDLLLPLLHAEYLEVRWAAALMLGDQREEAAFPVLIGMLQELLSSHAPVDDCWYEIEQSRIAYILGSWGKQEAIKPLRDTLAKLWEVEQHPRPDREPQLLWDYEDAVVYALGQLEDFDALADLDIPAERKRFWMVTQAMGYLNARHVYGGKPVWMIAQKTYPDETLGAFLVLVSEVLHEKLGMVPGEADAAVKNYDGHYFDRWEQQKQQ